MRDFKHLTEFIILSTDKNLGPSILNRDDYITQVLQEHLLSSTYTQLTEDIASQKLTETQQLLIDSFETHQHLLSQPEIDYFTRSFQEHHCIPIFYGMPKVHKTPIKLRPMVSCINSFCSIFSTWLDFKMKSLLPLISSYIQNSSDGYHENTQILPIFNDNLLYYKRYIDDIIDIWVDSPCNSWDSFKTQLNSFGSLHWNVENLTTSTTFLDLTIQKVDQKIQTSTFQKELNLYLYIPPISAHPTSCFKGLIVREFLHYWNQNSSEQDFINITSNFISRLLQRGHLLEELILMLKSAAATIDNANINLQEWSTDKEADETLYIHWQFHPKDINKSKICQTYNTTLKNYDNFQHMRVTMARPKNLRDVLCHTNIPMVLNNNISDILHNLLTQTDNT